MASGDVVAEYDAVSCGSATTTNDGADWTATFHVITGGPGPGSAAVTVSQHEPTNTPDVLCPFDTTKQYDVIIKEH